MSGLPVTSLQLLLVQNGDRAGFADEDQVPGSVVLEYLDPVLLRLLELLHATLAGLERHRTFPGHTLGIG